MGRSHSAQRAFEISIVTSPLDEIVVKELNNIKIVINKMASWLDGAGRFAQELVNTNQNSYS
jgi:hypothetical protein